MQKLTVLLACMSLFLTACDTSDSTTDADTDISKGLAHTTAEDEGTSAATTNFISWVKACAPATGL